MPSLDRLPFMLRLWDGTSWKSAPGEMTQLTLIVNNPEGLRTLCLASNELALGEAFIFGDFDIEGDIVAAFKLADALSAKKWGILDKISYGRHFFPLLGRWARGRGAKGARLTGLSHSRKRDGAAIRFHYDVSNDFYRLWLDERMVYSCGYFHDAGDDLDSAQLNKLDYICRKLRLKPGDRLLDIGCGWGGLILHAAKNYRVDAVGITLSEPQAELARERIEKAGLGDCCSVKVCDYRDMNDTAGFDKVVSVGMFEHVGQRRLSEYFRRAWDLLHPGGAFLNHGIASSLGHPQPKGPSFIDRYVFPDGELLPVSDALCAAETTGFEVRDLESLREHYALTLRHWVHRLETAREAACRFTDEVTYRIWRIYMAGSAHGFETGRLNLYQALLVKPAAGNACVPMTRNDWYC
nr:cyclopropane-fatty-acyl-phospholipid synthase [Geotalea sp. SG265]